eukprot:SAG31_NODE_19_length_35031_cov_42.510707_7_plen_378_part_00
MPSVAATLRMLLSLLAALTSGGPNMVGTVEATVRTFGSPTVTSWPSTRIVLGEAPSVIFNHTVSGDAQWACMDHFWITANSDLAMAAMGARLEVRYHFDGEPTPSVSFEPAMMSGNGWAAVPLAGRWVDGMSGVGQEGVYAAGDKVGRGGRLTGWFNNLRLPFKHSVFVTAQLATRPGSAPPPNASTSSQDTEHNPPPVNPPNPPYPSGPVPSPHCKDLPAPASAHCINADIIVRGFEDTSSSNAALTLPSGLTLPRTARMRLHHFVSQATDACTCNHHCCLAVRQFEQLQSRTDLVVLAGGHCRWLRIRDACERICWARRFAFRRVRGDRDFSTMVRDADHAVPSTFCASHVIVKGDDKTLCMRQQGRNARQQNQG